MPKANRALRRKRDFRNHADRDDSREQGETLLQTGPTQMASDESATEHAQQRTRCKRYADASVHSSLNRSRHHARRRYQRNDGQRSRHDGKYRCVRRAP